MELVDKLRASDVKRWHIVKTIHNQSLAEHAFNVAIISEYMNDQLWKQKDEDGAFAFEGENHRGLSAYLVLRWALYHDLPEVLTGDIPTPYKKYIIEDPDLVGTIDPGYTDVKVLVGTTYMEMVVKLSDLIESVRFLDQNKCDSYGQAAQENLARILDEQIASANRFHPQFDWNRAVSQTLASINTTPRQL